MIEIYFLCLAYETDVVSGGKVNIGMFWARAIEDLALTDNSNHVFLYSAVFFLWMLTSVFGKNISMLDVLTMRGGKPEEGGVNSLMNTWLSWFLLVFMQLSVDIGDFFSV